MGPSAWSWIHLDLASAPSLAHLLILWIGQNIPLVAQNGMEMGHFETRHLKFPLGGEGRGERTGSDQH